MKPITKMPAGLTPDMMAAITQFLVAQQAAVKAAKRPSGTLSSTQVRGVNPEYRYEFQEYPKALWPPRVSLANEMDERSFRVRNVMPLPWSDPLMITGYYAHRSYPVTIQPPQFVVDSLEEERLKLAEWNILDPARAAYPRWVFHPSLSPKLVNTPDEEALLGKGWFGSIDEAVAASKTAQEATATQDARTKLLGRASELGLKPDATWSTKRLEDAVAKAEKVAA